MVCFKLECSKAPGKSCKASYDLTLEVPEYFFYYIFSFQQITHTFTEAREEDLDSTT